MSAKPTGGARRQAMKHAGHLAFLHTSPAHVPTFDALLAELAPGLAATHIVDESLLADARRDGVTPDLVARVRAEVAEAFEGGAGALLCTCSTIGAVAEGLAAEGRPALRVDRAMAERAVQLGRRVLVAAALESTLAPTRELVAGAAAAAGRAVEIEPLLCRGAWERFEAGDIPGYHARIAESLRAAAPGRDVIVLAQASMAGAAALCADLPLPILSSPRLGLERALAALGGDKRSGAAN